jgi:hypothetical protein
MKKTEIHSETEDLVEKLLECEKDLKDYENESHSWTDSLRELSIIKDAFVIRESDRLDGKTILDIGTDCVKPLYIALKFEPQKIIGINEGLLAIGSEIEAQSKLLTKTKLSFYDCSFFDEETFRKIREKEGIDKFDFILLSKTLHHLRTGKCVNEEHAKKRKRSDNEKSCIYGFEAKEIFNDLFRYGKRIIVYEFFDPNEEDDDKVRGRGGYLAKNEWNMMFKSLRGKYLVKFITPQNFFLDGKTPDEIDSILKKVDTICFYVEEKV